MAISGFRHVPCGVSVNESERLAIERLKAKLSSTSSPWILLSNINHSTGTGRLSDEIDQIVIGPSGVFVVEVKHWEFGFLKQRPEVTESEAERIYEKARRVAGKLKSAFDPGFVSPRLLLTRGGTGMQANQRIQVRGVPVFGLTECKELVYADRSGVLSAEQIERAAKLLEPAVRVTLGDLRSFAGLINLERQALTEGAFHRIYRGQHPTRRDKVILHLYDLSATDEKDPKNRAEREFQVIQRWQKSPYLPNLLDSFQEAEHYPGELYYFSLVDPAAPSLVDRAHDTAWSIDERLRFAREALLALAGFHQPEEENQPPLVHRHITPTTLRVRHNGRPLFTDFSLARLSDAQTISSIPHDFGQDANYVAPETLQGGLAVADGRILKVNLDGSAAWQDKTANELLDKFFHPFHDLTFGGGKRVIRVCSRLIVASCLSGWKITHAVIFDEAHRAAKLKLIPTMAKECRKYGLAFVVASQEVKDFDPSLFPAIASYLALRAHEADAKQLANIMAPSDKVKLYTDRIKQMSKFKAWFHAEGMMAPVSVALSS